MQPGNDPDNPVSQKRDASIHAISRWRFSFHRVGCCLIIVCLSLVGTACGKWGKGSKDVAGAKEEKDTAIPVEVVRLERGAIETVLESSSGLEAESEVKVPARTANRVKELHVEEGDVVHAGDLLLQLDNDIQLIQVNKAKNQVDEAREEFLRQQSLYQQQLVSDQVFDEAKFRLRQLELNLEDMERELGYTEIRAPISGTITHRMVKVGDQIKVGQDLFNIIDFNSIVARLYVPEKELSRIHFDQQVRVESTAFPGKTFEGYVMRIAPVVESKSGMIKVTVGFRDVGPLLPGMYVDADIITSSKTDALLLPKKAIVYDGEQRFVFRIGTENQVERVLLEVGLEDADNLEPVAVLKEGDQVVIAGQTGLKDGSQVRVVDPSSPDLKPGESAPSEESTPAGDQAHNG